MKKLILILSLGTSCALPLFAQTISADSLYYTKSLIKDSLNVDNFIEAITQKSVYDVVEETTNGIVVTRANDKQILSVEIFKDSIYFSYIPLVPERVTSFHKASFIKKGCSWYYYCNTSDMAWAFYGMSFIEKFIDEFFY